MAKFKKGDDVFVGGKKIGVFVEKTSCKDSAIVMLDGIGVEAAINVDKLDAPKEKFKVGEYVTVDTFGTKWPGRIVRCYDTGYYDISNALGCVVCVDENKPLRCSEGEVVKIMCKKFGIKGVFNVE